MEGADVEQTIGLLRSAAAAMRSVSCSPADELRSLSAARNAIEARMSDLLAEMDASKAHEAEGAASIATWAQRELLQDPRRTRQMVRASRTMRDLPAFGEAARTGRLSGEHVNAMTFALTHVGHDETVTVEEELLTVSATKTPRELFALMRQCKAIAHTDDLDEAWLKGMDKQDIRCVPVGDGFHVTGFLPIDVGAKLRAFLDAVAVPRNADDDRSNADRRVDGLDDLVTKALDSGMPLTGGVRPHLSVIVTAERLKAALNGSGARQPGIAEQPEIIDREPTTLEGFGPIGPALLAYIAWGADLSPILVDGFAENRTVLDAGRTRRLATKRQRRIIWWRQQGRCANRGCHHPIGEIHHIVDWLHGGRTDLDNLAGLCRKCHALISVGRLTMTGTHATGYVFTTAHDRPLARTG